MSPTEKLPAKADPAPITTDRDTLTVAQVTSYMRLISAMKSEMREREHYGVIPGTGDKPTLLKPGAEKLCMLFGLEASFAILPQSVRSDELIAYVIRCTLTHRASGQRVAAALGSCNSREAKYRYRYVETDKRPSENEAQRLRAMNVGRWRNGVWCERVQNDNAWEHDNTLLKMAEKRALVAAVLVGTAASDMFTQDIEDVEREEPEKPRPRHQVHPKPTPRVEPPHEAKPESVKVPVTTPDEARAALAKLVGDGDQYTAKLGAAFAGRPDETLSTEDANTCDGIARDAYDGDSHAAWEKVGVMNQADFDHVTVGQARALIVALAMKP